MLLNRKILNRKVGHWLLIALFLALFIIILYLVNQVKKPELVTTVGRTFERAKVIEVVKENLQEDGHRYGEQQVRLLMLSGEKKGETVDATSSAGYLFGAACKPGMEVITIQSISGDVSVISVYSENREGVIYGFLLIFFLLHWLIGGRRGAKAFLGLVFSFICIIFLYVPLVFRGFSPFWAAVLVSVITTFVALYLIGGATRKSASAIIGAISGVIIAGIAATGFGYFAGISGYNVSDIESLLFLENNTPIKIGGLLFSGLLISSLGAVMDMAMSVASAVQEIHEKNPQLGRIDLFRSGMSVGKDTMGTMSNTLILAFAGGSVSMLVTNYAYDLPYIQMINSYNIGIEIMQGISGSMGVILTVPIVSAAAAFLLGTERSGGNTLIGSITGQRELTEEERKPIPEQKEEAALVQLALPRSEAGTAAEMRRGLKSVGFKVKSLCLKHGKLLIVLVCLLILLSCGIKLHTILSGYDRGDREYQGVAAAVAAGKDGDSAGTEEPFSFDYQKLAAQNSDAVGWLRMPGTAINYPVVQGEDNSYYLSHTFLKTDNYMGAVFMDSRIKEGFAAKNPILYGHNMRNGAMFASLCNFREKTYCEAHPSFEVYTKDGKRDYAVFSVYETAPDSAVYQFDFASEEEYGAYLQTALRQSLYDTGVEVSARDSILTLSTCVNDDRDVRFIVQAKAL